MTPYGHRSHCRFAGEDDTQVSLRIGSTVARATFRPDGTVHRLETMPPGTRRFVPATAWYEDVVSALGDLWAKGFWTCECGGFISKTRSLATRAHESGAAPEREVNSPSPGVGGPTQQG